MNCKHCGSYSNNGPYWHFSPRMGHESHERACDPCFRFYDAQLGDWLITAPEPEYKLYIRGLLMPILPALPRVEKRRRGAA